MTKSRMETRYQYNKSTHLYRDTRNARKINLPAYMVFLGSESVNCEIAFCAISAE